MVGILLSFWEGQFSGAMLVLGRVTPRPCKMIFLEDDPFLFGDTLLSAARCSFWGGVFSCHVSSDQTLGICCIYGILRPSSIGFMISHYKDPVMNQSVWWNVSQGFLSTAHNCQLSDEAGFLLTRVAACPLTELEELGYESTGHSNEDGFELQ